jgi:hypothetical protein
VPHPSWKDWYSVETGIDFELSKWSIGFADTACDWLAAATIVDWLPAGWLPCLVLHPVPLNTRNVLLPFL